MAFRSFLVYATVQVAAYGIDLGTFVAVSEYLHGDIIVANIAGKFLACLFAFFMHRWVTFGSKQEILPEAFRYILLAIFNSAVGSAVLYAIRFMFGQAVAAKIVSDVILVVLSFAIAKLYVFAREAPR